MAAEGGVSAQVAINIGFDADVASKLVAAFKSTDADGSGFVDNHEVVALFKELGKDVTQAEADAMIADVDVNSDGKVSFDEFCVMFGKAEGTGLREAVSKRHGELQKIKGAVGEHSYSEEEKWAFTQHFNFTFEEDKYLTEKGIVPMEPDSMELFSHISDGIMLAKFINLAKKDTLDERALNYPKRRALNKWEKTENLNVVINSAKAIGCTVVNLHASDLESAAGKEYLVLGLLWQLVKIQLLSLINIKECPELVKLLEDDETLEDLLALPPEDILLRWINYHMAKQECPRRAKNFTKDLKDGEIYANLLHSITPELDECNKDKLMAVSGRDRAAGVIAGAGAQGVRSIIQPTDIVKGNKRLKLAFCAQIFNNNHGLGELTEEEKELLRVGLPDDAESDAREERVFRMWMNSLNLQDGSLYINSLFDGCLVDGLYLLEAEDKVEPGSVDWKKVQKKKKGKPLNKIVAVQNCNQAVTVGKDLGCSLVGIGGVDINANNRKLILALVWQLMRKQVLKLLRGPDGKDKAEADVLRWANGAVKELLAKELPERSPVKDPSDEEEVAARDAADGLLSAHSKVKNFTDASISNGLFLLNVVKTIKPEAVDPALVLPGADEEEAKQNLRYFLTLARAMDAQIFCTWEDLYEVKKKMVFITIASVQLAAEAHAGISTTTAAAAAAE
ncbi:fim1 [Symbiodinium sp. KB8]|nr:fim1 [Symbiodinium sp. KB8]